MVHVCWLPIGLVMCLTRVRVLSHSGARFFGVLKTYFFAEPVEFKSYLRVLFRTRLTRVRVLRLNCGKNRRFFGENSGY